MSVRLSATVFVSKATIQTAQKIAMKKDRLHQQTHNQANDSAFYGLMMMMMMMAEHRTANGWPQKMPEASHCLCKLAIVRSDNAKCNAISQLKNEHIDETCR